MNSQTLDLHNSLLKLYSIIALDIKKTKTDKGKNSFWVPTRYEILEIIKLSFRKMREKKETNELLNDIFLNEKHNGSGVLLFETTMQYLYYITCGFTVDNEEENRKLVIKKEVEYAFEKLLRYVEAQNNFELIQNFVDILSSLHPKTEHKHIEEKVQEILNKYEIKNFEMSAHRNIAPKTANKTQTILKEFGENGLKDLVLHTLLEKNSLEELILIKQELDQITKGKGLEQIIRIIASSYGIIDSNKVAEELIYQLTKKEIPESIKKIIFINSLNSFGFEQTISQIKYLKITKYQALNWIISSIKLKEIKKIQNYTLTESIYILKKEKALRYLWKKYGNKGIQFILESLTEKECANSNETLNTASENSKIKAVLELLKITKPLKDFTLFDMFKVLQKTWELESAVELFAEIGLEKQAFKYYSKQRLKEGDKLSEITSAFFNIIEYEKAFETIVTNSYPIFAFKELVKRIGFKNAYLIAENTLQNKRITDILAWESGYGKEVFLKLKNSLGLENALNAMSQMDCFGPKETAILAINSGYLYSGIEMLKNKTQNEIRVILDTKGIEGYEILSNYWSINSWTSQIINLNFNQKHDLFSYLKTKVNKEEYSLVLKNILKKQSVKKLLTDLAEEINWNKVYENAYDLEKHYQRIENTAEVYKIIAKESSEIQAFKILHNIIKSEYGLYAIRSKAGFENEAFKRLIRTNKQKGISYIYKTSKNSEEFLNYLDNLEYGKEAVVELGNKIGNKNAVLTSLEVFGAKKTLQLTDEAGFSSVAYSEISKKEGAISAFNTAMKVFNNMEKAFYLATLNNEVPIIFDQLGKDLGYDAAIKICVEELGSIKRVINYSLEGYFNYSNKEIEIPKEIIKTRIENLINAYHRAGYGKEFLSEIKTKKYLGSKKEAIKIAINMLGENNGIILAGESFGKDESDFTPTLLAALAEIPKTRDQFIEILKSTMLKTQKPKEGEKATVT
ncbi:hypothetical protein KO317_02995 [Candidatus Micrarchaeota archaeon]|nr:hypothetical protein [Candidatus Micrarchaeota archaeon]